MKSKTKWLSMLVTLAVVFVLVLSLGLSTIFASAADGEDAADPVRYYNDYGSEDETYAAMRETNLALEEEGIVLLKNDGTLPLSTTKRVSVFGMAQDCITESPGAITDSLRNAGFNVNATLESFYLNDGLDEHDYGEETALGGLEKSSVQAYSDVGVFVLGRGLGGENTISVDGTAEEENETYLDPDDTQGWTHEASPEGQKHELELTESEKELLAYVEQSCKKVVVLYSGEQVFELGNLEDDDNINGMLWIGRPGDGGMDAVGEVLSGKINPSGKTVDEWTRDLTNDPTYANVGPTDYVDSTGAGWADADSASGENYNGIDYEEDIYLGYKFYETYWLENKDTGNVSIPGLNKTSDASAQEWYDYNVVYPFGYGLSYTSFSYDLQGVKTYTGATDNLSYKAALTGSYTADDFSTTDKASLSSAITAMSASVKVTNTGSVEGKETVEIYVEAPYTSGGIEKPAWTLVGFGKTDDLDPGESETLEIFFNVQDFASFDYAGANNDDTSGDNHTGYELDLGSYIIHVMGDSSHDNVSDDEIEIEGNEKIADKTNAYEAATFSITAGATYQYAAHLDADDYSGNKVETLFSDTESVYYSMATSSRSKTMISPLDATQGTNSTMLSRADFDSSMPTAVESAVLTKDDIEFIETLDIMDADDDIDAGQPWEKTVADLDGWTQDAEGKDADGDGIYDITLNDMAGLDFDDPQWVAFMNQLTWDEICTLLNDGYHLTASIPTIGKVQTLDENGPNYINNGPKLTGAPTRAATWSEDLMYLCGVVSGDCCLVQGMTGYYGPGINTHRSPFGGRNAEYFGQDDLQTGYMAAALCQGMADRGINVYVKHFALYDSNSVSAAASCCVNVSEQNMRENYLKVFQMCMQEGRATACMTSLNRIGGVYAGQDYALLQQLARDEWGWNGYYVTDNAAMLPHFSMDGLIRAGANLPDGDYRDSSRSISGTWDATYDWSDELTDVSVTEAPVGAVILTKTVKSGEGESATETVETFASATQWYLARMAAQQILYNQANSAGNYNGITVQQIATQSVSVSETQAVNDESGTAIVDGDLVGRVTSSEVTTGSLPDGMYVESGKIYGIPTGSGTFTATVVSYVDNWIPLTSSLTITVAASMTMEFDVSNLNVGDDVDVYVFADVDGAFSGYNLSFSLEGDVPTGLEITENGWINGTVTEAGTYTFSIVLAAVDPNAYYFEFDDIGQTYYDQIVDNGIFSDPSVGVSNDAELIAWMFEDGVWGPMPLFSWFEPYIREPQADYYYLTYTITVSGDSEAAGASGSSSSGSSGMAIAALVVGIVALVAAAAVLVVVLLKRNNGGSDGSKDESDAPKEE